MFSYYGSKSKIVHLYPAPKHDLIIEPFAGSARYALRYFDRDVILIDKYPVIVEVWKYLQSASAKDILSLPKLSSGDDLRKYRLSRAEKNFLGFLVQRGVTRPGNKVSVWKDTNSSPTVADDLKRISQQLFKIRHWEIRLGDYKDSPSAEATWFIDPPYFKGGQYYSFSSQKINFLELKEWVQTRRGQILVCENASADWMEFQPLKRINGARKMSDEVFWTNEKIAIQENLF